LRQSNINSAAVVPRQVHAFAAAFSLPKWRSFKPAVMQLQPSPILQHTTWSFSLLLGRVLIHRLVCGLQTVFFSELDKLALKKFIASHFFSLSTQSNDMGDTSYKKLLTVNEFKVGRGLVSSSLELLNLSNTTSYEPGNLAARIPDDELKWNSKPRKTSTALGHRLTTWTQETLRSFRLLLPMAVGPRKDEKKEQPKVALHTGWVSVLSGLLIHVVPLAACITLVYWNIASFFLSSQVSTLAFQFLAKFLELFAQASLGSAVFVYLRALYTGPNSVPFGALFAGLQITSISYLWSLEFAGVATSKSFKRTQKFPLLLP
ncbi:hypothetical protein KCU91_g92, partial [Aureobasidium melanogenum]